MNVGYVVDWVIHNIESCDLRLTRAIGEMAWALAVAGKVSYTEIARAIEGKATAASKHKRVHRFCNNERVDPAVVQRSLIHALVGEAVRRSNELGPVVVPLAMDWHTYDNGEICGLRISLVTGSRAIPLLWYEVRQSELKGRQTDMEREAIEDLKRYRPPHVTWLFLLDCGFHAPEVLDALNTAGYFIVRSQVHPLVHLPKNCWMPVGSLPVDLETVVEFGWVTWSLTTPRVVRLVVARMPPAKQRSRRGAKYTSKQVQPGYCPLITNLPEGEACTESVLRIYCRRFEIEHSFRDIVSSTRGLDMEHVHLKSIEAYSRLLCIVAVTEAFLWLCGAEAERLKLNFAYSSSRPKDGRRVVSFVRLGRWALAEIRGSIRRLVRHHLRAALSTVMQVTGRTWRRPTRARRLVQLATGPGVVPRQVRRCRRRRKKDSSKIRPCHTGPLNLRTVHPRPPERRVVDAGRRAA